MSVLCSTVDNTSYCAARWSVGCTKVHVHEKQYVLYCNQAYSSQHQHALYSSWEKLLSGAKSQSTSSVNVP